MSKYIVNSFQVPNAIVDEVMARVSGNAFKCYMLIVRKTTGWHKTSDRIAATLFIEKAGIGKKLTVYKALEELETLKLIISDKKRGQISSYQLNFDLLTPYPEGAVPEKDTGVYEGNSVVPKKDITGSTPDGHSTKHLIKHTKIKHTNTSQKSTSVSLLLEYGISSQLAEDWLLVRQSKKASFLTKTALDGLIREATKAGLTVEQAIQTCIERNWVSLKAEWLIQSIVAIYHPKKADQLAAANRSIFGKGVSHDVITGNYEHIS